MKRFASAGARSRRGAGRLGQGVVTLGAALLASCYFVVDRDGDQCSTDGDCRDRGPEFSAFTCDADQKLCVNPGARNKFLGQACTIDANCRDVGTAVGDVVCDGQICVYQAPANECQTNNECTQKAGGKPSLCRRPDRRCVLIESEDCAAGDPLDVFQNANAIVFGTLLTNRGPYVKDGLPIQNAVAMATTQIDQGLGGLPGGPNDTQRPIAFVFCHEGDDTFRAARHLTDTLRVPAIIGASISDFTIEAASKVTIPSGVLLISPGATSISITDLPDKGLVWRTAPSDVVQSDALARLGESLQQTIRNQLGPAAPAKLRIAVIGGNDIYGQGFSSAFTSAMTFNGVALNDTLVNNKDVFLNNLVDFPVKDEPEAQKQAKQQEIDKLNAAIVALAPHIIVLIGSSDVATYIMDKVDSKLTAFPPYYLLADGAFGDTLSAVLQNGEPQGLRRRVRITAPGATGDNFNAYLGNYNRLFTDDGTVFGAAGAYDATYLLALAASSLAPGEVTGPNLATALAKTADTSAPPERVFDVRFANNVGRYFNFMDFGDTVNFNGASGPLDFNDKGEATADIQIFCADEATPGVLNALPKLRPTGRYYDALAEKLEGADACDPVLPLPPPTNARATP